MLGAGSGEDGCFVLEEEGRPDFEGGLKDG